MTESTPTVSEATDVTLWVRTYTRHVHGVAYSILRDHHDAEDVAQETFLRVLRNQEQLEQIENPRAWLSRIAWNLALDRVRERKHRAQDSLEDATLGEPLRTLAASGTSAEELVAQNQMQQLMARMIETLPEDLRHTLQLSLIDGTTSRDVAELLQIPEGTVRTRLMRARQILREKLASYMGKRG